MEQVWLLLMSVCHTRICDLLDNSFKDVCCIHSELSRASVMYVIVNILYILVLLPSSKLVI